MGQDKIKSYKVLSSSVEYQNSYFQVIREKVVLPDGKVKDFFILKKGEPNYFALIIPLTASGKTYLIGQYRPAIRQASWEFPMGHVDGVDPLGMAKIELKQETGLTALAWREIGSFYLAPGHTAQKGYVFVAEKLKEGRTEFEDSEFLAIRKDVDLREIKDMIDKGKITDGPTIIAYYFLEKYLQ